MIHMHLVLREVAEFALEKSGGAHMIVRDDILPDVATELLLDPGDDAVWLPQGLAVVGR